MKHSIQVYTDVFWDRRTVSRCNHAASLFCGSLAAPRLTSGTLKAPTVFNPFASTRRSTSPSAPEDKPTTVFELTQVDGEPERSTPSSTVAINVSSLRGGERPTAEIPRAETHQSSSTTCSTRGAAEEGGERGTSPSPENANPPRSQRRAPRDGDSAAAATAAASRVWKPNVHRPLEWFPVPGRQLLLVDPTDVNATTGAAGVTEETAATAAAAADRPAGEPRPSSGVDLGPRDRRAVGDRGGCNNRDTRARGGGDPAEHRRERRRGPRDKEAAEQPEEGGKQAAGRAKEPRNPEAGHERTIQEGSDRSEIVLSARSKLPSAAPVVGRSCSPAPTDANARERATARARLLSGRCRARPHTSASRAWGGCKADTPSGGVTARKSSTAIDFLVSPSQTKVRTELRTGGNRSTPEAGHRETACASMSALGRGAFVGPLVTAENTRIMPFSPPERHGERAGGRSGGRFEVGKSSPDRQRRAEAAVIASPTSKEKGGLQFQRLPVRTMATAGRASSTARKQAVVSPGGPPRERRHTLRGLSHSQPQRAAISGWEGEETSVVKAQDRGTTGSCVGRARGRGGADMLPTPLHSDNVSWADTFSDVGSANSGISSYCGWNKMSNI